MKKPLLLFAVLLVVGASLAAGQRVSPQGGTITSVQPASGGGLVGGGNSGPITLGLKQTCSHEQALVWNGSLNSWECTYVATQVLGDDGIVNLSMSGVGNVTIGLRQDCDNGEVLKWTGGDWDCDTDDGGEGDITDVIAGTNMDGGGSTGSVTLDLAPTILLAGAANETTFEAQNSATDQTSPAAVGQFTMTGSVDTIDGDKTTTALSILNTTTNTGGNNLINRGLTISVQNGDTNTAFHVQSGDSRVQALQVDGNLLVAGASSHTGTFSTYAATNLGDGPSDAITVNGLPRFTRGVGTSHSGVSTSPNIWLEDTTDQAAGVGGGILFSGETTNSSAVQSDAASIKAMKENGTSANSAFGLSFATHPNGGSLTQAMYLRASGVADFASNVNIQGSLDVSGSSLLNGPVTFDDDATFNSGTSLTVAATTTHTAPTTVADLRGTVQTSSSTGAINDFSLNSDTTVLVLTGAAPALTGITGGAAGRLLLLVNTNTTATATLSHETTSTSFNRFQIQSGQTHTLGPGLTWLYYDGTLSRWLVADDRYNTTLTVTGSGLFIGGLTSSSTTTLGDSNDDVANIRMPKDSGTAPTLSSCGTSPTVTGGSWAFTITAGTGGITACTATFASTKTNAPACIATQRSSSESVYLSSVSATAITITARSGTTDLSSDVIDVICIGDA